MQGERKTMKSGVALIKRGSAVSLKRPVRVYEDCENPELGKRMKENFTSAPLAGLWRLRRPLADINNMGAGDVKGGEDSHKADIVNIKKADEGHRKEKDEVTKEASDVIKAIVASKNTTIHIAEGEQKAECSNSKNKEEHKQQVPDRSVTAMTIQNLQKEKIQQQDQKVFSVTYYGTEIYKYLFAMEKRYEIPKNHLEGQVLNGLMRAVLVDWLASVVESLDLMQETFQLTVYTMDKFMAINKTTTKASAQLIGLGALFVAAKYEETESIELNDLTFFCDKKWNGNDIKSIECTILKAVDYQLGRPLAIHFIRRLSKISGTTACLL